ncbi:hypothetical protein D3C76_1725730 [compost metagenome]
MLLVHFQRRGQQRQYVTFVLRHQGDLRNIGAQFLHFAQAFDDFLLRRRFMEIMIRHDDFDVLGVGMGHGLFDQFVTGK